MWTVTDPAIGTPNIVWRNKRPTDDELWFKAFSEGYRSGCRIPGNLSDTPRPERPRRKPAVPYPQRIAPATNPNRRPWSLSEFLDHIAGICSMGILVLTIVMFVLIWKGQVSAVSLLKLLDRPHRSAVQEAYNREIELNGDGFDRNQGVDVLPIDGGATNYDYFDTSRTPSSSPSVPLVAPNIQPQWK